MRGALEIGVVASETPLLIMLPSMQHGDQLEREARGAMETD